MGECLITEVAALREENERLRTVFDTITFLCMDGGTIDARWLMEQLQAALRKDSPCIPKT